MTTQQQSEASQKLQRLQLEQQQRLEFEQRERDSNRPRTRLESARPDKIDQSIKGNCVNVSSVLIEGADLMSGRAMRRLVLPYEAKCLYAKDIEQLLSDVTNYYIDKGYIAARAYVKRQNTSTGILYISVVEGSVEKIILNDEHDSVFLATAFPFIEKNALNLRDIEQGLDQINRLPSNNATVDLKPGSEAGNTFVIINNESTRRISGNISFDSNGSIPLNEHQLGVGVGVDNPLGLNDSLNVTYRDMKNPDVAGNYSQSGAFMYSIPFGYYTFSASHFVSDYVTPILSVSGGLRADGDSSNTTFSNEYIAYRGKRSRVALTGSLSQKNTNNYLAGQLLSVSSRRLSIFDFGSSVYTSLWGGDLNFGLSHAWGLDAFDALKDPDDLPDFAPRAQFKKWTANIGWVKPFTLMDKRFDFASRINGQIGRDVLYGSERLFVGSFYSVRGYSKNSLSGDSGFVWRNDLAMSVPLKLPKHMLLFRPYIAYDFGSINDRNGVLGGSIGGMAAGFGFIHQKLNLSITYTKSLHMPSRFQDEEEQVFLRFNINI